MPGHAVDRQIRPSSRQVEGLPAGRHERCPVALISPSILAHPQKAAVREWNSRNRPLLISLPRSGERVTPLPFFSNGYSFGKALPRARSSASWGARWRRYGGQGKGNDIHSMLLVKI